MNNSILIRWDTFHINHRLLREERVGRQARHQIDREADDGPVSGVLDLRDVLKLIVDGLDQSPLAQEDFVRDCHKLALHVALKLCYQLDAVHEKSGEEVPADVSLVSDQLSEDPFDEGFVPERIHVVNIARCEHEVQEFPLFAADQMQFEAVEPSHRTLPPLGESLEYLVGADALVPAHAQGGAVHETDAVQAPMQHLFTNRMKGTTTLRPARRSSCRKRAPGTDPSYSCIPHSSRSV